MGSTKSCEMNRTSGVRGLSNCCLSCSINALLQSFSATTELQELLSRWQLSGEPTKHNVPLELKKALTGMKDNRKAEPHLGFLECLHYNHICRSTQHDADEVFLAILTLIQKQMSDQEIAAEIKNLYKIEVDSCSECQDCKNVRRIPNIFLSFPLHLQEDENTLEDCFRMFFESQTLDGSDAVYCLRCEMKKPTVQRYKLTSLPSILCLNLKRFRNIRGCTRKMNTKVIFPETIDMAKILPEEHSQSASRYRLYAVIVHLGTALTGHYTAFVCGTDDKWCYIDDESVSQVSWADVQKTYGETRWKTAYMLLYRKLC